MGWYMNMSHEEMQEQFGEEDQQQQQQQKKKTDCGCSSSASTAAASSSAASSSAAATAATTAAESESESATAAASSSSSSPASAAAATAATASGAGALTMTPCPLPTTQHGHHQILQPPPVEYPAIYHLCRKQDWDQAVIEHRPYFSRTFVTDGRFLRASLRLESIIDVANWYYYDHQQKSPPDEAWIVLEINPHCLYYTMGIPILADVRAPASHTAAPPAAEITTCLQIFGGLSTNPTTLPALIPHIYPLQRTCVDGKFVSLLPPIRSSSITATTAAAASTATATTPLPVSSSNDASSAGAAGRKEQLALPHRHGEKEEQHTMMKSKQKKKKKEGGFFRKLKRLG